MHAPRHVLNRGGPCGWQFRVAGGGWGGALWSAARSAASSAVPCGREADLLPALIAGRGGRVLPDSGRGRGAAHERHGRHPGERLRLPAPPQRPVFWAGRRGLLPSSRLSRSGTCGAESAGPLAPLLRTIAERGGQLNEALRPQWRRPQAWTPFPVAGCSASVRCCPCRADNLTAATEQARGGRACAGSNGAVPQWSDEGAAGGRGYARNCDAGRRVRLPHGRRLHGFRAVEVEK